MQQLLIAVLTGEDVRLISVWELLMDVLVDLTIQLLVI